MDNEEISYLKFFEFFGMEFISKSGDNYYATCPFSDKKGKFYVNQKTGLWDSKSTGKSGNIYDFMNEYFQMCLINTTIFDLKALGEDRKTPISAFLNRIAKNYYDDKFLIPTYNSEKRIVGLGLRKIGGKIFRAPYTKLHIHGLEEWVNDESYPIYVCEGEWDYYSLKYLHEKAGMRSNIISLPGAHTFKEEWIPIFDRKDVVFCYDNDEAGRKGEKKAISFLGTKPYRMRFIYWADSLPEGYDLRDFITGSFQNPLNPSENEVNKCVAILNAMITNKSYYERNQKGNEKSDPNIPLETIEREELEKVYSKWLKMTSYDPLAIIFGTCFANRIQGDPVWMFIISPPGGSKTELLMTLNKHSSIETVTTLTPAALLSGTRSPDGAEHSLFKLIDGRMLIIKDFTAIISGNPLSREEIASALRDIYDGYYEKYFNFGKKSVTSHFGIIAGVTPIIDSLSGNSASMGERFIKFRLESILKEETEQDRIRRVIDNIDTEKNMRGEMQDAAAKMLNKKIPEKLPEFKSVKIVNAIIDLAMFTARMRGSVPKDKFSGEQITKPITEIGTRLSKQFMKLAIGIAIYLDHSEVGDEELRLLRMVARDTCPDRIEELIKKIYLSGDEFKIDLPWFCDYTKFSNPTVLKMTQDLCSLGLLDRVAGMERVKSYFMLDRKFRELIKRTRIYEGQKNSEPEKRNEGEQGKKQGEFLKIKIGKKVA